MLMKSRIYSFLLVFVVTWFYELLPAQSIRSVSDQQHAWVVLNGNTKLNERFSVFHDFQFRRDDFGMSWQQLLLRAGLTYKFNNVVTTTVGYAFVQTHPYGDFPVASTFPEHRIFEQLQLKQEIGKSSLIHRYRLEQRMIGNSATGEFQPFRFENEIRYLGRFIQPVIGDENRKLSAVLYDEIFVNFGKNVGRNVFDQNRIFAGFNYAFSKKVAIEIGYLNQMIKQRGLTLGGLEKFENNHTIMFTNTLNF